MNISSMMISAISPMESSADMNPATFSEGFMYSVPMAAVTMAYMRYRMPRSMNPFDADTISCPLRVMCMAIDMTK